MIVPLTAIQFFEQYDEDTVMNFFDQRVKIPPALPSAGLKVHATSGEFHIDLIRMGSMSPSFVSCIVMSRGL